jgi:hypothetical protein
MSGQPGGLHETIAAYNDAWNEHDVERIGAMHGVGRTLEERLRIEAEMVISMFMRRDPHTLGAAAFKARDLTPEWPHHGL